MPVLSLQEAFTARAIATSWDNYQKTLGVSPYLGRSKFGTRKQVGLDLKFIKGKSGLPVSLKGSALGAQADLRDAIGFSEIENSMPFFRESYMLTEKENQEYDAYLNASNETYANQVLANIMKNPMMLIDGARVVPERMIWQLLTPVDGIPKINVVVNGKNMVIDYTADSGVEHIKDHFTELTGSDKWDESATATPLEDLIEIKREFAKKTGYALTRFTMNTKTFEMILKAEDTKKQVLGITAYNGGIRLRREDVVSYLAGEGIQIEVYDKMYLDENKVAHTFIPDGMISAQTAGVKLGDVVFGTTPEERSGSLANGSLSIVETGIATYTYTTEHPLNTHCVVSEIVLPTFEGMDATCVIKAY